MPSVQHIPCLRAGCQDRRTYYAIRCPRTNSRGRCGKGRTENTWWEDPRYFLRALSNGKERNKRLLWLFSLSFSGMSVMLLELMLPKSECLSAAPSLSICQGKKKKKVIWGLAKTSHPGYKRVNHCWVTLQRSWKDLWRPFQLLS